MNERRSYKLSANTEGLARYNAGQEMLYCGDYTAENVNVFHMLLQSAFAQEALRRDSQR